MTGRKRLVVVFSVVVPVALVCVVALSGLFGSRPPVFDANAPEQAVEYLASEQFVKMGMDDKRQYLEEIRQSYSETPMLTLFYNPNISESQREKLMANVLPVIGPMASERIDEFESLPAQEQTARLDAIIDQMERFRQDNPDRTFSPQRLALILQYMDPHTRARIRKHIPALTRRMAERGIFPAYPFQ